MKPLLLKPSDNPVALLDELSPALDPDKKMYHTGFERYMNGLFVMEDNDPNLRTVVENNMFVMKMMAYKLATTLLHKSLKDAPPLSFTRTMLAIEEPVRNEAGEITKTGAELVLAKWAKGFVTPIHGHSFGFMSEYLISGKVQVENYELNLEDETWETANLIETKIATSGKDNIITSIYAKKDRLLTSKHRAMIHRLTFLEDTATLHYLPAHPLNGIGNTYTSTNS